MRESFSAHEAFVCVVNFSIFIMATTDESYCTNISYRFVKMNCSVMESYSNNVSCNVISHFDVSSCTFSNIPISKESVMTFPKCPFLVFHCNNFYEKIIYISLERGNKTTTAQKSSKVQWWCIVKKESLMLVVNFRLISH